MQCLESYQDALAAAHDADGLCGEDAALGIHRLDQHLVLAARQVNPDDEVALATSDAALRAKALVAIGPPFQTLPRRSQNHSPGIY